MNENVSPGEVFERDLLEILGPIDMTDYCSRSYWRWEDRASARLVELGYIVGSWWTGDGDSFGPLVRCVRIEKDGKKEMVSYG